MPYTKTCQYVHCGKVFVTKNSSQKYCSYACSGKARADAKATRTEAQIRAYLLKRTTRPEHPDTCWTWHGHISKKTGYAIVCIRGYHYQGHRISYETFVAPIPEGMHVLHARHCTSRSCINPRHLRCGTNAENMADKVALGSPNKGSDNPNTRLMERDVLAILDSYHEQGCSIHQLSRQYGISRATLRAMIQRKTWRHVAPDKYPPVVKKPSDFYTLTEKDVRTIRTLYEQGASKAALARQFHVTPENIRMIVERKTWKHID